jgi:GT2 family glycosyltransferase
MGDRGPSALSTVAIVPREAFSSSVMSLESIVASLPSGQPIVYVDGGSPRRVRRALRAAADRLEFVLIRTDEYLAPNQARNLAWSAATTEYVVFIDNDAFVEPGWLEPLERCAEETGAWAVAPMICEGAPIATRVHAAGGWNHIEADGRQISQGLGHFGEPLADVIDKVAKGPTEFAEFHCLLVRRSALERLGPLDERLLSLHEHVDLCLAIRQAGGEVWFEPASVVTYVWPDRLRWSDLPFWCLRWSDRWNRSSLEAFGRKWGLAPDNRDMVGTLRFGRKHRRDALPGLRKLPHPTGAAVPVRAVKVVVRTAERMFESTFAAIAVAHQTRVRMLRRTRLRRRPVTLAPR